MAPIAYSGLPGAPSFRTRQISSGAPNASASSAPTGTPPRGSATTVTVPVPPRSASRAAS